MGKRARQGEHIGQGEAARARETKRLEEEASG